MNDQKVSKFLSFVLRHKPDAIGLELDPNGWADVGELLQKSATNKMILTLWDLQRIVEEDEKQRYTLDMGKLRIRANQGHSIDVAVELEKKTPPPVLYHGTSTKSIPKITVEGLKPMSRLYVHLSDNEETARSVGARHGHEVVLYVNTEKMQDHEFFLSANGVWLTKFVPVSALF